MRKMPMPEAQLNYAWEEVICDGREYTLELTISVDWSPFRAAKTNCDPEDGHPAEGGDFEVTEVRLDRATIVYVGDTEQRSTGKMSREEYGYWLRRFEKEIRGTDHFRDWLGEQISDEESGANEPEDDGR